MWEFDAKQMIRALEVPRAESRFHLRVVEDGEGLAAVGCYEEVDGPSDIYIVVGGVASRLRGKGGG